MKQGIKLIVGILALFMAAGCDQSQQQKTSDEERAQVSTELTANFIKKPSPPPIAQTKPEPPPLPTYLIVDKDIYDVPLKTQIKLSVVVSGTLTELGLKQLLQKLYDEANATRGFKYHGGKPTHVAIYLYSSQEHFKSGMGQWIAMLTKIGQGALIDTEVKTELIAQLDSKPEVKHDLSEEKRKEIFKAAVSAEDRARVEAERMYPLLDRNPGWSQDKAIEQLKRQNATNDKLKQKYSTEMAKRYRITEKVLSDIEVEGLVKNWPMP